MSVHSNAGMNVHSVVPFLSFISDFDKTVSYHKLLSLFLGISIYFLPPSRYRRFVEFLFRGILFFFKTNKQTFFFSVHHVDCFFSQRWVNNEWPYLWFSS